MVSVSIIYVGVPPTCESQNITRDVQSDRPVARNLSHVYLLFSHAYDLMQHASFTVTHYTLLIFAGRSSEENNTMLMSCTEDRLASLQRGGKNTA